MDNNIKVSIVVPIYPMKNHAELFWRCIDSITKQTFKDYEIIITQEGGMAENTNAGIKRSRGELIKILFMDDWFAHADALKHMVEAMEQSKDREWLITACDTNPYPKYTEDIEKGNNRLGSPSALIMRKESALLFDENMSWLLDCDLYKRLYIKYGEPVILEDMNVNIGIHDGQATNILSDNYKLSEHEYMRKKYD